MTIRIEITDVTNEDKASLVRLAKYLLESAGHQMVYQAPQPIKKEDEKNPVKHLQDWAEDIATSVDKSNKVIDEIIEKNKSKRKKKENIGNKPGVEKANKLGPEHTHEVKAPSYAHCAVPIPPITQINFNTFMIRVTALRREEKITDLDLLNIVRKHGLDKTHMLSVNPDLVPLVNADLDKFLEGK